MGEVLIKEVKNKWVLKISSKNNKTIEREANSLLEITTILFEMADDLKKPTGRN